MVGQFAVAEIENRQRPLMDDGVVALAEAIRIPVDMVIYLRTIVTGSLDGEDAGKLPSYFQFCISRHE